MNETFEDIINNKIKQYHDELKSVNILIAGKTGVGKSTLINSLFEGDYAETGVGKPVTEHLVEITKNNISIYDSRGIVLQNYENVFEEIKSFVEERKNNNSESIDIAWVCIVEGSSRVEEAEIQLVDIIAELGIPVIIILTKALFDQGLKDEIKELCPKAKDIIRVHAKRIELDDGYVVEPTGLNTLTEITYNNLSDIKKNTFISEQYVNEDIKNEKAKSIIEENLKICEEGKINNEETLINIITNITGLLGFNFKFDLIFEVLKNIQKTDINLNDTSCIEQLTVKEIELICNEYLKSIENYKRKNKANPNLFKVKESKSTPLLYSSEESSESEHSSNEDIPKKTKKSHIMKWLTLFMPSSKVHNLFSLRTKINNNSEIILPKEPAQRKRKESKILKVFQKKQQ
ncbi:hypothetical protein BCR36DRAFT_415977 [Piromyces finnis]|uniref:G domain-containing protein n=1 Tax=Piromyces finnis TaxID=1754191 RepID=A0A1Y1UYE3_9FUNG|nr:hypothetical protein BCR36DRAFT_415977 [Piromyces finnis]|eukprot:ORX42615.1 hypothetical protein BCR36DRAFT_415977 [Piromyces finnis]